MRRFIEVDLRPESQPLDLVISIGDVVVFRVGGARVRAGDGIVELLGPLLTSVLGDDHRVYTPEGPPNVVAIVGRRSGHARIELKTGDPYRQSRSSDVSIEVEA